MQNVLLLHFSWPHFLLCFLIAENKTVQALAFITCTPAACSETDVHSIIRQLFLQPFSVGPLSNIFVLYPPPSAFSVFLILSYIQGSNKNSSVYQFALVMFVLDHCTHKSTETTTSLNQELSSRDFIGGKKTRWGQKTMREISQQCRQ